MPLIPVDKLRHVVATLLEASGASADEAATVSRLSVAANLAGHDSHGVIQIPTYIDRIGKGHIVPGAPFEVKQETATTMVVDGNWGFGYSVAKRATEMTIEKAKTSNVAATTSSTSSQLLVAKSRRSHGT